MHAWNISTGLVVVSSVFSKCPNCEALFPIFVHIETKPAREFTEAILRCTCYQCGAHVDCTLVLGDLAEAKRNAS